MPLRVCYVTVRGAIRYAIACSAIALVACRDPRPTATLELPLDFTRLDQVRSIPGPPWDSVDTPHLRLYTEPGAYAARHIAATLVGYLIRANGIDNFPISDRDHK